MEEPRQQRATAAADVRRWHCPRVVETIPLEQVLQQCGVEEEALREERFQRQQQLQQGRALGTELSSTLTLWWPSLLVLPMVMVALLLSGSGVLMVTVMGAGLSLFALSAWRLSLPLFARILGGCAALFLAVGLYLALSAMYMQHQEHLQLQKERDESDEFLAGSPLSVDATIAEAAFTLAQQLHWPESFTIELVSMLEGNMIFSVQTLLEHWSKIRSLVGVNKRALASLQHFILKSLPDEVVHKFLNRNLQAEKQHQEDGGGEGGEQSPSPAHNSEL